MQNFVAFLFFLSAVNYYVFDFVVVTETWCDNASVDLFQLPNYVSFFSLEYLVKEVVVFVCL